MTGAFEGSKLIVVMCDTADLHEPLEASRRQCSGGHLRVRGAATAEEDQGGRRVSSSSLAYQGFYLSKLQARSQEKSHILRAMLSPMASTASGAADLGANGSCDGG